MVLSIFGALAVAGCGSGEDEAEKKSALGSWCTENSQCETGFCPQGGVYENHCTSECDDSDQCVSRHGDNYFCHIDNVCVKDCIGGCGDMRCNQAGIPNHCTAE